MKNTRATPIAALLASAVLSVAAAAPSAAEALRITETDGSADGLVVQNGIVWTTYPYPAAGKAWLGRDYYNGGSGASAYNGQGGGAMTFGADGCLWWVEFAANRVWKYDFNNAAFTPFNVGAGPVALTAGPDGNIWIAERTAGKIARLTPSGVLTEFQIPTLVSQPTSIISALGNLWFTSSNVGKIGKVTPAGAFTEFVIPRQGPKPMGITHVGRGTLYFTEAATNRITRFYAETGTFSTSFEVPTPASEPTSMVAGTHGEVWFTERAAGKIGRFEGGVFKEFETPTPDSGPDQIVNAGDGTLYFLETEAGKIGRVFTSVPGDANADGTTNVGDVFYLISYLFAGGLAPKL